MEGVCAERIVRAMNDLLLIVKIAYYVLFVFSLFFYARYKYKKDKTKKFGMVALIVFSVLFGFYGIICGPPDEYTGDRHNYSIRFEDPGYGELVKDNSLGLYAVESVLHIFTNNSGVLFFTISVLYFYVNIICYKKLKDATPLCLLLFFLTNLGLYGFLALKQAPSLAFINLALAYYFQKRRTPALISLTIAILFHEAAWIVVPCFILARLCKGSQIRQLLVYISMVAVIVLFPQISSLFVKAFSFIPGMDSQIGNYVSDSGSVLVDLNIFTIIKSLPFYLITIAGLLLRKDLKSRIDNYDFLLALSVFCSILSVLSMYLYWMYRFAMYCYLPCFVLASQLASHMKEKNAKLFKIFIVGVLFVLLIKLLMQYYFIYGGII